MHSEALVASQGNGRWGTAIEVPGTAALNPAGDTEVSSVACAPAGNCTAGGSYEGRHGSFRAFVAIQRNGRWDMATLNAARFAAVRSVSCAPAGRCLAGGRPPGGPRAPAGVPALPRDARGGAGGPAPPRPGAAGVGDLGENLCGGGAFTPRHPGAPPRLPVVF